MPEVVLHQLQEAAANDVRELLPHLQNRAKEYAEDAIAKLKHRADDESKKMREILEAQKKHLQETVTRYSREDQLILQFSEEEKRQLEANQRYWDKRLVSLEEVWYFRALSDQETSANLVHFHLWRGTTAQYHLIGG